MSVDSFLIHHQFCEECKSSGPLTTDRAKAEREDADHEQEHHSGTSPEGEDA